MFALLARLKPDKPDERDDPATWRACKMKFANGVETTGQHRLVYGTPEYRLVYTRGSQVHFTCSRPSIDLCYYEYVVLYGDVDMAVDVENPLPVAPAHQAPAFNPLGAPALEGNPGVVDEAGPNHHAVDVTMTDDADASEGMQEDLDTVLGAGKAADAPVEAADAPVEAADPPVEAADPPVEAADAPVEAADAPVEAADAPVEAADAPVKAADPPAEAVEDGTNDEEAAFYDAEPPAGVAGLAEGARALRLAESDGTTLATDLAAELTPASSGHTHADASGSGDQDNHKKKRNRTARGARMFNARVNSVVGGGSPHLDTNGTVGSVSRAVDDTGVVGGGSHALDTNALVGSGSAALDIIGVVGGGVPADARGVPGSPNVRVVAGGARTSLVGSTARRRSVGGHNAGASRTGAGARNSLGAVGTRRAAGGGPGRAGTGPEVRGSTGTSLGRRARDMAVSLGSKVLGWPERATKRVMRSFGSVGAAFCGLDDDEEEAAPLSLRISKESLRHFYCKRMVSLGTEFDNNRANLSELARQLLTGPDMPRLACALEGPHGSGKLAIAAAAVLDALEFENIYIISAAKLAPHEDKAAHMRSVFKEARSNRLAAVVIRDPKKVVEWQSVVQPASYKQELLQALVSCIEGEQPDGHQLLIIITSPDEEFLNNTGLVFDARLPVSPLTPVQIRHVLEGEQVLEADDLSRVVRELGVQCMTIKAVMSCVGMLKMGLAPGEKAPFSRWQQALVCYRQRTQQEPSAPTQASAESAMDAANM